MADWGREGSAAESVLYKEKNNLVICDRVCYNDNCAILLAADYIQKEE